MVFDTNFVNGKTLRKPNLQNSDQYPIYKVRVLKYLKGSSTHKVLTVKNYHLAFGVQRFPKPLVGVRDGKKMIFSITKIKDNGEAVASTSSCSHRFTKK